MNRPAPLAASQAGGHGVVMVEGEPTGGNPFQGCSHNLTAAEPGWATAKAPHPAPSQNRASLLAEHGDNQHECRQRYRAEDSCGWKRSPRTGQAIPRISVLRFDSPWIETWSESDQHRAPSGHRAARPTTEARRRNRDCIDTPSHSSRACIGRTRLPDRPTRQKAGLTTTVPCEADGICPAPARPVFRRA